VEDKHQMICFPSFPEWTQDLVVEVGASEAQEDSGLEDLDQEVVSVEVVADFMVEIIIL
jgi:hypothetical protein